MVQYSRSRGWRRGVVVVHPAPQVASIGVELGYVVIQYIPWYRDSRQAPLQACSGRGDQLREQTYLDGKLDVRSVLAVVGPTAQKLRLAGPVCALGGSSRVAMTAPPGQ